MFCLLYSVNIFGKEILLYFKIHIPRRHLLNNTDFKTGGLKEIPHIV